MLQIQKFSYSASILQRVCVLYILLQKNARTFCQKSIQMNILPVGTPCQTAQPFNSMETTKLLTRTL